MNFSISSEMFFYQTRLGKIIFGPVLYFEIIKFLLTTEIGACTLISLTVHVNSSR